MTTEIMEAEQKQKAFRLSGNGPNALGKTAVKGLEQRLGKNNGQLAERPGTTKARMSVRRSIKAFKKAQYDEAAKHGLEGINHDDAYSPAYHSVALALEKMGELHKAMPFFEKAVQLDPGDAELYYNLGNTAWRLDMHDGALKLFRLYVEMDPKAARGHNNLASLLRDMGRYDDALETIRAAIYTIPEDAYLWNTLGTVVTERGDVDEAAPFYTEALRINPKFGLARHNIAYAQFLTGQFDQAVEDWRLALKTIGQDFQRPEAEHGLSQALLGQGKLEEGFTQWECRHDKNFRGSTLFGIGLPRWSGQSIKGKRLLICGEQGVGDEVMFANAVHDLIDEAGPKGKVLMAVERRLVSLFERSFPQATVRAISGRNHNGKIMRFVPWTENEAPIDFFTPLGDTLRHRRKRLNDFKQDRSLLTPDPERVTYWRTRLEATGPGPYVGLCWRSGLMTAIRRKFYCPLDQWSPILTTEGPTWINLQYDECTDDRAFAQKTFGADIRDFDNLDLKNDLDDNAALCAALDLVISAPTAAAALSGAVGTQTWILSNAPVWMTLGTDHYPWYQRTAFFAPATYADWPELMSRLGENLSAFISQRAAA